MNIKKLSLVGLLSLLSFVLFSGFVYAVDLPIVDLEDATVEEILVNVINFGAGIIVVLAILVIVIAGIMWTTAGGNEDQQAMARKMVIAGIVGLIIGLAAFAIVQTVIGVIFP